MSSAHAGETRRRTRALREAVTRYELVLQAINEAAYDWDIAANILTWSDRATQVLCVTPAQLRTPASWRNAIHPDDLPGYDAAHVAHFKERTDRFEYDYRYRTRDGSWRWVRQRGVTVRDARGRALRLIGSCGDITAFMERERELATQKAILETTLENIDQGITMVDANLHTIALNRKFLELLDLPPERFARGFHMEQAFRFNAERGEYGPGDVDEQVRSRLTLARRFEAHAFERVRPDGRIIAIRGQPLSGGGFVSTYTDVTEQRRAEQALRENQQRYELAMRASGAWIYEWDLTADAAHLFERPASFSGVAPEDVTPADWIARIHPDDRAAHKQALVDHFKGVAAQLEREYRVYDNDGELRWVLERGVGLRDAGGRVCKLVGALSDITPRKRAEVELRLARDQAEEALDQQTATTEILRVISSLPNDTQPVFDAIVQTGLKLFADSAISVALPEGGRVHAVAVADSDPARAAAWRGRFPFPLSREYMHGVAILDRKIVDVPDVQNAPPQWEAGGRNFLASGYRAITIMPMLRGETAIGALSVVRAAPGPLSDKQLSTLKTFADQAVIAIENVRLLNETKEALDQQTATAAVLKAVAQSQTDVQPVFEIIADYAARLCDALFVGMFRYDDERVHFVAQHNVPPALLELFRREYPRALDDTRAASRAIASRTVVEIPDVREDSRYSGDLSRTGGWRRAVAVPMLRGARALGAIAAGWREPGPVPQRQLDLLKVFADLGVIAIENVRLFNEIRDSLEQQKASSEVLGVISGSIADTAPVFDKILESCQRLFAGTIVGLNLVRRDGMLHIGAYHGQHREEFEKIFPIPLTVESGSGLSIIEHRIVHYPDTDHGPEVPARTRTGCKAIGIKSVIFAPVLWEGRGLGAIFVGRDRVSSFSDKEIALLKTFADQAAIAIENVGLFNEIQEKSRQLEIASRHKSEFLANMSHELRTPLNAIIGFTRIVLRRSQAQLEPKQYENLEKILASGQHLLALINAVLDISKVEAGRVEINASEIDPGPVLEHCARTVEPLIKSSVTLIKDFGAALPQMVVDEEKLRQIVINLLSNAAKFTTRGSIRLRAQPIGDTMVIAVVDSGIGIAADKLESIFEEFEQADASSTRVYGGTGLGLAIARRLARLMGGDIDVTSAPGQGSTFALTLPLRYGAPP
jgi:PAS domain S-box-containing protein